MSRRLEPTDVAAIHRLRATLKEEESSHSSNTPEDQSTLDDPSLDPFHQDLLIKDKLTDLRIIGHELQASPNDAKEFAVRLSSCRTIRSRWRQSICATGWVVVSVSSMSSTDRRARVWPSNVSSPRRSTILLCLQPAQQWSSNARPSSTVLLSQCRLPQRIVQSRTSIKVASCDYSSLSLPSPKGYFPYHLDHYEQKQLSPSPLYKKCNS